MATVRIYGSSDDLIEVEGEHAIAEEYGATSDGVFEAVISSIGKAAIRVIAQLHSSVWMVGVAPYDEGYAAPAAWNLRLVPPTPNENEYTSVLELDLPESATLEVIRGVDHRS